MFIIESKESKVLEEIDFKTSTISEQITEAIIEMNIMREKKVSRDDLIKLIENYSC